MKRGGLGNKNNQVKVIVNWQCTDKPSPQFRKLFEILLRDRQGERDYANTKNCPQRLGIPRQDTPL